MQKYYAIKTPKDQLVINILEITEGWAWAEFYSIQETRRKYVQPSEVPPDWITSCKCSGFKCVEIKEVA